MSFGLIPFLSILLLCILFIIIILYKNYQRKKKLENKRTNNSRIQMRISQRMPVVIVKRSFASSLNQQPIQNTISSSIPVQESVEIINQIIAIFVLFSKYPPPPTLQKKHTFP